MINKWFGASYMLAHFLIHFHTRVNINPKWKGLNKFNTINKSIASSTSDLEPPRCLLIPYYAFLAICASYARQTSRCSTQSKKLGGNNLYSSNKIIGFSYSNMLIYSFLMTLVLRYLKKYSILSVLAIHLMEPSLEMQWVSIVA